jgi:phosphatidate cytidylyltransferase
VTGDGAVVAVAVAGAGTAILAQIGDLGVSMVKRRFGAKDSGSLIPGHGGLLDRMDGFVGAAPVVALAVAVGGGGRAPWF